MLTASDSAERVDAYHARARVQREAADWLAEWLPENGDSPALELGAGTGFFTRHLLRSVRHVVATDASPHMVEAGRSAAPGARWFVAEASNPPTESDPYRSIFTSSLVQWLPDPAAAFTRWHEVTAPESSLLGGWFIRGTMDNFLAACPEGAPFTWRSAEEWDALLRVAGWRVKRSETRTFQLVHDSSVAMLRDIHDVGTVVPRRLGPGRLRAALRDNDRRSRAGRGVVTPFVFLRVEAVRT